jgi:hypothetical protein
MDGHNEIEVQQYRGYREETMEECIVYPGLGFPLENKEKMEKYPFFFS